MERHLPPALSNAAATIRARFGALFPGRLRQLRLFGSYARGDATAASDIDILVVLDRLESHAERIQGAEIVAGVGFEQGLPFEAVVWSEDELAHRRRLETGFVRNIDGEGIAL